MAQVISLFHHHRQFLFVLVDIGTPVDQEAELVSRYVLYHLVACGDLPAIGTVRVRAKEGFEGRSGRFTVSVRPTGFSAVLQQPPHQIKELAVEEAALPFRAGAVYLAK